MRGSTRTGIAVAGCTTVISGVAVFVNAYGVKAVADATVYTAAKNLVAALLLSVVAVAAAGRLPGRSTSTPTTRASTAVRSVLRRHWYGLLAVAVIGGSVPFVLFFEGLARASSVHAAFVHKTLIIWVALFALPMLGERLRGVHYLAIGLLLGGLVVLDGGLAGFRFGVGEVLLLTATLLWAAEVIVVKRLLAEVPAAVLAVARMGLGVVLLLAWVTVSGRLGALAGLGAEAWAYAALTGLLLAGYVGSWYHALALAPAIDVTAILVPAVVITTALNAVATGTFPRPATTLGAGLMLAGATILAVRLWRRAPAAALAAETAVR